MTQAHEPNGQAHDATTAEPHIGLEAVGAPGWLRFLEPIFGAALFVVALWVLAHELRSVRIGDVTRAAQALPAWRLWLAGIATFANYFVITGYDHLALRQLNRRLSPWRVSLAGFVAFAVVNNVGFALISGPWARYRFYTRWKVDVGTLPQVAAFNAVTVWTGLFGLLGLVLAANPDPALAMWAPLPAWRVGGLLMVAMVGAYVYAAARMTGPLQIWRWALHMPSRRLALAQVVLSSIDWLLIAAVLWLLVPGGTVPFGPLLGSLLAAQLLGLISHVPGGLGVFEGSMLTLLHGDAPPHVLLAGLLLFRIVFYLVPLVVALVIVAAANLTRRPPGVRTSTP